MPDLLFVYGTLKRGYPHPMAQNLADAAAWRGAATAQGRLYRVASYPGFVLSDNVGDLVHGDLYAIGDAALWAALDAYEGCDAPGSDYRRDRTAVTTADGTALTAWTYVWIAPVDPVTHITDGRFV